MNDWTTNYQIIIMHVAKKCPPKCQNIGRPRISQCSLELWQVEHMRVFLEDIHHGCSQKIVLLDPVRMKTNLCDWCSSMTTWTKWGTLNSLISMQQILFFFFRRKFPPTQLLEPPRLLNLGEVSNYKIILSCFQLLFCCFKDFKVASLYIYFILEIFHTYSLHISNFTLIREVRVGGSFN